MRQPIQLWLPLLSDNLSSPEAQRDARRAMEAWSGELKVWLLPELKKPVRWYEGIGEIRFPVLAVPAEHTDLLRVYHIGSSGRVWGPASNSIFPDRLDGYLDAWLNLLRLEGGLSYYHAPQSITTAVPRVTKKGVRFRKSKFGLIPGPTWQLDRIDRGSRVVTLKWPPDDRKLVTVSPEAESSEYFGPLRRTDQEGLPTVVSERDPKFRSLHLICMLPKPLKQLAPYGVGMDTLFGHAQMVSIARLSKSDPMGALRKARDAAGIYVTEGQTTQELAWLLPTMKEVGVERGLQAAWFRFDLQEHRTLKEAMNSPAWREELKKPIPIRRAWGILGLFWSLLLDRLERSQPFNFCEKCGRPISSRKGRRFCGRKGNRDCYRARRAADRRKERSQGRAKVRFIRGSVKG
jgi:hypothetical protein